MNRHLHSFVLLMLTGLLFVAACARGTPTPVPPTATAEPTPTAPPTPTEEQVEPLPTASPTSPAEGTSSDDTPWRFVLVAEESTACYRVREQLVGVSLPNDAVGCTSEMEGQIVVRPDGTIVQEESYIRVNLDTLTSDESRRDRYIKNNTLNTAQYPEAVFVPTALEGVPAPLPTTGEGQFRLVGRLTIRDVTREVVWDVTARATGNRVEAQATTAFTFDDFQLTRPRVPVVLSIEDPIRLEVTTVWERVE